MLRGRGGRRDDRGFTLLELLIAITIMGIIIVPTANLVLQYFLHTAAVEAELNESHDAQIASQYWGRDVSSVGIRGPYDTGTESYPLQASVNVAFPGSCTLPAGSTTLIVLGWDEHNDAGTKTAIRVAYVLDATSSELLRVPCGGSDTLTSVLAHNVDSSVTPYCQVNGSSTHVSCSSISGVPSAISMTLRIADPSGEGEPYDLTLAGQRRQT